MRLIERINHPERNQCERIVQEEREPERQWKPRWLQWTEQNQSRGKSLDGRAA